MTQLPLQLGPATPDPFKRVTFVVRRDDYHSEEDFDAACVREVRRVSALIPPPHTITYDFDGVRREHTITVEGRP